MTNLIVKKFKDYLPECFKHWIIPIALCYQNREPEQPVNSQYTELIRDEQYKYRQAIDWTACSPEDLEDSFEYRYEEADRLKTKIAYGTRLDRLVVVEVSTNKKINSERQTAILEEFFNYIFPTGYDSKGILINELDNGTIQWIIGLECPNNSEIHFFMKQYFQNITQLFKMYREGILDDQRLSFHLYNEKEQINSIKDRGIVDKEEFLISYEYNWEEGEKKIVDNKYDLKQYTSVIIKTGFDNYTYIKPTSYNGKLVNFRAPIPEKLFSISLTEYRNIIKHSYKGFQTRNRIETIETISNYFSPRKSKIPLLFKYLVNDKGIKVMQEDNDYYLINCPFHEDTKQSAIFTKGNSFHCPVCNLNLRLQEVYSKFGDEIPKTIKNIVDTRDSQLETSLRQIGFRSKRDMNKILRFECGLEDHKDPNNTIKVVNGKLYCEECGHFDTIEDYLYMLSSEIYCTPEGRKMWVSKYGTFEWHKKGNTNSPLNRISPFKVIEFGYYSNPVIESKEEQQMYYLKYSNSIKKEYHLYGTMQELAWKFSDNSCIKEQRYLSEQFLRMLSIKPSLIEVFNKPGFYINKDKILFSNGITVIENLNITDEMKKCSLEVFKNIDKQLKRNKNYRKAQAVFYSCIGSIFGLCCKQLHKLSRMLILTGQSSTGKSTLCTLATLFVYSNKYIKNIGLAQVYGAETAKSPQRIYKRCSETSLPIIMDESNAFNSKEVLNTLKSIAGYEISGRKTAQSFENTDNMFSTLIFTTNDDFTQQDQGLRRRADWIEFTVDDIMQEDYNEITDLIDDIKENSDCIMDCFIDFCFKESRQIIRYLKRRHFLYQRGLHVMRIFLNYLGESIAQQNWLKLEMRLKDAIETIATSQDWIYKFTKRIQEDINQSIEKAKEAHPELTHFNFEVLGPYFPKWFHIKKEKDQKIFYFTPKIEDLEDFKGIKFELIQEILFSCTFTDEDGKTFRMLRRELRGSRKGKSIALRTPALSLEKFYYCFCTGIKDFFLE